MSSGPPQIRGAIGNVKRTCTTRAFKGYVDRRDGVHREL